MAAKEDISSASHSQPFARAHCSTCRCPERAALRHVNMSYSQPFARAYSSTLRCPPLAACAQVYVSQLQPCARAHFSTSKCPLFAANAHVHESNSHPLACAHCRASRCPPPAICEQIPNAFRCRLRAPISVPRFARLRQHCCVNFCPSCSRVLVATAVYVIFRLVRRRLRR